MKQINELCVEGCDVLQRMLKGLLLIISSMLLLVGCNIMDSVFQETATENNQVSDEEVTALTALTHTENFQNRALAHILEGELNKKGNAVGFHYERLPSKKGEVIAGSETKANEYGVYEAKVIVSGVSKTSNQGKSTFFPKTWDSQDVVDAINEAYEAREFKNGNTYEGVTKEGMVISMYLNNQEKIISAFPIY